MYFVLYEIVIIYWNKIKPFNARYFIWKVWFRLSANGCIISQLYWYPLFLIHCIYWAVCFNTAPSTITYPSKEPASYTFSTTNNFTSMLDVSLSHRCDWHVRYSLFLNEYTWTAFVLVSPYCHRQQSKNKDRRRGLHTCVRDEDQRASSSMQFSIHHWQKSWISLRL